MTKLEELLEERGMRIADLARETGIASTTLYDLVRGRTDIGKMRVSAFLKVCEALDISPEELYYGKKPPTHDKPLSPAEKAFNSLTAEKKEAFMRLMDG